MQKMWHRVEVIQPRKERDPNNIFPGTDTIETTFRAQGVKLKRDMTTEALLNYIGESRKTDEPLIELSQPSLREASKTPEHVAAKFKKQ